jgi:antibiotic biosynthesis monooxygenase (ABM) superfamily enzyme
MIYVTQLIYLIPGRETEFYEFEDQVLPLMERYSGKLLLRVRPDSTAIIAAAMEKPFEIHFMSFDSEELLQGYRNDAERKKYLYLKEDSVRTTFLTMGSVI